MTLNCRGTFVPFSINKSVEPNEEQKVLVSDFGKELIAGLKDNFLGVFGISNEKVKTSKVKITEEQQVAQSFWAKNKPSDWTYKS